MQILTLLRLICLAIIGLIDFRKKSETASIDNQKDELEKERKGLIDEAYEGDETAKKLTDVFRGKSKPK